MTQMLGIVSTRLYILEYDICSGSSRATMITPQRQTVPWLTFKGLWLAVTEQPRKQTDSITSRVDIADAKTSLTRLSE